jgi:TIGR02453 family protein
MIEKSTIKFLSDLSKNNYREWFNENKSQYESARENIFSAGNKLFAEISKFDSNIIFTDPKKCMFRIYRDVRFSKDKEPYKTNMGMVFSPDGTKKCQLSSYYMHVEPKGSFVSCGVYMPDATILKSIRLAIDEDFEAFSKIIENKAFKNKFGSLYRDEDALSRVPAGFDKDSPAAEYLKLKHFYVFAQFTDAEVCSPDYIEKAAEALKLAKPLQDWLNKVILN